MQLAATVWPLFLLTSAVAQAAPRPAIFHSQGLTHRLTVDPALMAVRDDGPHESDDAFARLGVKIVPRSARPTESQSILGAPVWLASGAVGIVTRRVLIGAPPAAVRPFLPQGTTVADAPFAEDIAIVTTPSPEAALTLAEEMRLLPGVRWAHPDFHFQIESRSDPRGEPLFESQWHLDRAAVPTAWETTTGSASTVVAAIDLGFESSHPDLADAWLVNLGEIAGNRRDDDANGLVDDVAGWNFAVGSANLIYGANSAHGTAVAGVIGARANGAGVTGICPGCRVLPLVIDNAVANAAAAFRYAATRGATVISNSWGYAVGTPTTDVVVEAINRVAQDGRSGKGTTIVFAMSNFHRDDCRGTEPDISSLPSVVAVSAVDKDDLKVEASGFGACLKLVAPSSGSEAGGVLTTDRPGTKGYNRGERPSDVPDLDYTNTFYGTSAATPQVTAAFALMYSRWPALTRDAALRRMLDTTDKIRPDLAGYDPRTGHSTLYGYGRINVGRALTD